MRALRADWRSDALFLQGPRSQCEDRVTSRILPGRSGSEADNLTPAKPQCGDVAQLAERYLCKVDVRGSIPLVSTRHNTSSDHMKAPLSGAFVVRRCTPGAQHDTASGGSGHHTPTQEGTERNWRTSGTSEPHRTLQARATLAIVSSNRRLVTAEQLDAMSPNERAAVLAEHIVMDLDELPEGFRERVVATGQRLATERDQAATG